VALPTISIVTPSFNQAEYLEECIESVLGQGYPRLEYVIMDGGSTDGSEDIIKKYAKFLTYWQSQPDGGQYRAVNEGFRHTTGEIMAWLNSDDKYHPLAFAKVASVMSENPEVRWLTGRKSFWDAAGNLHKVERGLGVFSRHKFILGDFDKPYIQQESTFWRRALWEQAGGFMDAEGSLAGDLELWLRFFRHAPVHTVDTLLGGYRFHGDQRGIEQAAEYRYEGMSLIERERSCEPDVSLGSIAPPTVLGISREQVSEFIESSGCNPAYPNRCGCWSEYTEDLMALVGRSGEERLFHLSPFWRNEIGMFSLAKPRVAWLLEHPLDLLERGWKQLAEQMEAGLLCEREGKIEEAERYYRTAYQSDEWFAPAAAGLLRCLQTSGRIHEALQLTSKILQQHAHDADVVKTVVQLLLQLGAVGEARSVCEEFVSVNPHVGDLQVVMKQIMEIAR